MPSMATKIQRFMFLLDPSIEDLPEPIMVDILSRLPVKTIVHCKCVCKKWRNIILDSYFANIQLSRSPAGIMIHHNSVQDSTNAYKPGTLKWVEVKDEPHQRHLHHNFVMSLDLSLAPIFRKSRILAVGSLNGLICLWQFGQGNDNTYICNPITREYMMLPRQRYYREGIAVIVYCLGFSSLTREYKVIRIFEGDIPPNDRLNSRPSLLEAEVYTLGTDQWRSLGHIPYCLKGYFGPFLNGHAHWMIVDQNSPEKLYSFDFDKETFKLFPSPPIETREESEFHFGSLAVLNGCLCQSGAFDSEFRIWMMKEYGVKKSWHKVVKIKQGFSRAADRLMWNGIHVIDSLDDGTILIVDRELKLLAYCPRTRTIVDMKIIDRYFSGLAYRPSFLKLQNFESERVHVF